MHIKDGQGPTLGEMQPSMSDDEAPQSPFKTQHLSPKEEPIAAATHHPPMSVVVIQESTESPLGTLNNEDSQGPWAPPSMVSIGTPDESRASWQRSYSSSIGNEESTTASPGCFSSPFRLKPRNPGPFMSASPSRAGRGAMGAARGRKRPAHSMSIPVGSVSSNESPLRPPRPFYGKDDRSDVSSTKGESASAGSESTAKDSSLSPPIFEMECLNLKSLSSQSPTKQRASSFQMYGYGVSPAGSITRAANTTSSMSESSSSSFVASGTPPSSANFVASGTPSSSARSSPRHVPLTVLSNGQSLISPSINSMVRPPRHEGGPSLLFSLDNDESEDENIGLKLAASSCNSSISSEEVERKMSPHASPRTPLPRIMLTPRTPQSSCGSRRKAGLPMFPSPSDDGIDTTGTNNTLNSSIDEAMDTLLNGFAKRGHPGKFQSTTGYIPPSNENLRECSRQSSNSLAYSLAEENQGDFVGASRGLEEQERRSPSPTALESNTVDINPPALPKKWLLPVPSGSSGTKKRETDSLNFPPSIERTTQPESSESGPKIARHDEILRAMITAKDKNDRERDAHADSDSLSDSEEDEFVLTCPSNLTTTSDMAENNRPPKQRRRESQDSAVAGLHLNGGKESCASLGSGLASASSLFGMEFYQDDAPSMASPLYRSATPFSSQSVRSKHSGSHGELSTKDDHDGVGQLGIHEFRRRSENSFASLGLSLDGPPSAADERDLATPPATSLVAFSPPPPPVQSSRPETFIATPKSTKAEF